VDFQCFAWSLQNGPFLTMQHQVDLLIWHLQQTEKNFDNFTPRDSSPSTVSQKQGSSMIVLHQHEVALKGEGLEQAQMVKETTLLCSLTCPSRTFQFSSTIILSWAFSPAGWSL